MRCESVHSLFTFFYIDKRHHLLIVSPEGAIAQRKITHHFDSCQYRFKDNQGLIIKWTNTHLFRKNSWKQKVFLKLMIVACL